MNITNMPGFRAEASVYASTTRYRSTAAGLQGEGATIIPAQYCKNYTNCGPCRLVVDLTPPGFSIRYLQTCHYMTCIPNFFGGCDCTQGKLLVDCEPVLKQ
jgi:hypothetical protein